MPALTNQQEREVASYWAQTFYGLGSTPAQCATFNLDNIQAGVHALDAIYDTPLSGLTPTDTVLQAISKSLPAPINTANVQQKTLLASHTMLKRSGLI